MVRLGTNPSYELVRGGVLPRSEFARRLTADRAAERLRAWARDGTVRPLIERALHRVGVTVSGEELEKTIEVSIQRGKLALYRVLGLRPAPRCGVVSLASLADPWVEADPPRAPVVSSTWFQLTIVDELGERLPSLLVHVLVDSVTRPLRTDGAGRVWVSSPEGARFASARIVDMPAVRRVLADRWASPRSGERIPPGETRTFLTMSGATREHRVQLANNTPHTVVFVPEVALARFPGCFPPGKSFVLPGTALSRCTAIRDAGPHDALLVVGHTDTSGSSTDNATLSLERAASVVALLRRDVEAWLAEYDDDRPAARRWGAAEDHAMLLAVLQHEGVDDRASADLLRTFQRQRGLPEVDPIEASTRRRLIHDYMESEGVEALGAMGVDRHGCGEQFPCPPDDVDRSDRGASERDPERDRRIEIFVFGSGLGPLPKPVSTISNADAPHYETWVQRASDVQVFASSRATMRIHLRDEDGQTLAGTRFCILWGGLPLYGRADARGVAEVLLPERCPETLGLAWGAREEHGPFPYARTIVVDCESDVGSHRARARLQNLGFASADRDDAADMFALLRTDHSSSGMGLQGDLPPADVAAIDDHWSRAWA